ncbi:MAG: hypothetical protein WBP59_01885 [Ilumatobacteraceae bacterium]
MITTGSKFLIGSTVLATIAAIAYGVTQSDAQGTIGLVSAAVALGFLAGVNLFTRDANVWADEISSTDTAPAAAAAPANSVWPMVFALGAVVVAVGLVTQQSVFTIGIVILLAAGAEWTAQAWSERASADATHNAGVRSRIANPLEFPLAAAVGIGIIVYSFSRIMLWLSKTNTVIAFSILGTIIVVFAFFFAYRPALKSRAVAGVIGVGVVGLVAGGVAAGVDGEREIHPHHSTEQLAEEGTGICTSPDEFPSDHGASQRVAATASAAAYITLTESGELTYELDGPVEPGSEGLTLPRSNPNNVIFYNDSGEDRRMSVDIGTHIVEHDGEEVVEPHLVCTALVEDGGAQNITLIIGPPSITAEDGYFFFVPGVDSARLNLIVP